MSHEGIRIISAEEAAKAGLLDVSFKELASGMVLAEDVYSTSGTLILARGAVTSAPCC